MVALGRRSLLAFALAAFATPALATSGLKDTLKSQVKTREKPSTNTTRRQGRKVKTESKVKND